MLQFNCRNFILNSGNFFTKKPKNINLYEVIKFILNFDPPDF